MSKRKKSMATTDGVFPMVKLPREVREKIRKAFRESNCMDLWKENAIYQLDVIAQVLRERRELIEKLDGLIKSAVNALNGTEDEKK